MARQANKGAAARQAAIPKGSSKNWRKYSPPNFDSKLVNGLVAVIKGAVKPGVAAPILKAAGPSPVAAAVNIVNGNVPKNIAPIAAGVISNGNQSEAPIARALNTLGPEAGPPQVEATPRDPEAIGNVFYAGKRVGYAYGNALHPMFKRKSTTNKIPSWRGWYLEPAAGLENVPRFEFVHKNYKPLASVTSDLSSIIIGAIQESAPKNVTTGLASIITGAIPATQSRKIVMMTRSANMPEKVANIGKNISNIVTNVIKPLPLTPTQKAAANREPWKLPVFGGGALKVRDPWKFPLFGGARNKLPASSMPAPVYANRLSNNALSNENKTELASAPVAQQTAIRKSLFDMFKGLYVRSPNGKWTLPKLTEEQKKQVRDAFRKFFNKMSNASPGVFGRVFGGPKKPTNQRPANQRPANQRPANQRPANQRPANQRPANQRPANQPTNSIFKRLFAGLFAPAKKVVKQTQNAHNNPGNKRRLDALEKALKELKESLKNSKQAPVVNEFIHKYYPAPVLKGNKPVPEPAIVNRELHKIVGPGNYSKMNIETLFKKSGEKNGPKNSDLLNRLPSENNRGYQRRMETFSRHRGESNQNYNKRIVIQNRRQEIRKQEINRRRRLRGGLNLPPANQRSANQNFQSANLPPVEQKALDNVGGPARAANIVAQVPGGIPAVAKAAQSVNEVGRQNAVLVHENHPLAVEAVKKLGGHNNTIHVLEGLRKTMRRRRPAVKKPLGPRKAVLNELLKEARKVNLAPVVARMVTKTGKVKQTLRKYKKNYNKKLIRSAIFRTRAANIARNAAKKK